MTIYDDLCCVNLFSIIDVDVMTDCTVIWFICVDHVVYTCWCCGAYVLMMWFMCLDDMMWYASIHVLVLWMIVVIVVEGRRYDLDWIRMLEVV